MKTIPKNFSEEVKFFLLNKLFEDDIKDAEIFFSSVFVWHVKAGSEG